MFFTIKPSIMKSFQTILTLFILLIMNMAGLHAQQCDYFIPLRENTGMEFQTFNARDRLQGSQEMTITRVESDAEQVTAIIRTKIFDRRDNMEHEGEYSVLCSGNQMSIDIESMMDPAMMEEFQEMDLSIEGQDLIIPADLSEGQTLPDAAMTITVANGGMTLMEMNMKITDRKVVGKEQITVPAGEYDCYKVSYQTTTESKAAGIPFKNSMKTVEYYAPNVGVVRTEMFDAKDRLQGYTVLSRVF